MAAALLCAELAHAQIVADPGAPGGQRPSVLAAPNGVPLVNIQTPSAAGVSRNTYSRFDVGAPGAILNNSRANTQAQLGGWVQGNPWLARGSARVILNEVNSGNPSQLRGTVEVAGPRSEVVIANPAGIAVDGAGFINASRVTLTTGVPVINGGNLEGYRVQRGTIGIFGRGLDAGGADYAAILARAAEVNAGIWARHLTVAVGAQQASADGSSATPIAGSGAAPVFLLDVAKIGGMYAGHIFLRGTADGLGMRNAGTLASTGRLTLSSEGWLSNSGVIQAAGPMEIAIGQSLGNSGRILGQAEMALQASDIANSGTIQAGGAARLSTTAGDISNRGASISAARLALESAADIDNTGGTLRQGGGSELRLSAAALDNSAGGTVGNRPVADAAPGTGGTATPPAHVESGTGTGSDSGTAAPPAPPVDTDTTPGTVHATGSLRNQGGTIASGGGIALAGTDIDNHGGFIAVERVDGALARLDNRQGRFSTSGDLSVAGAVLDNTAGTLLAGGNLAVRAGRLDNAAGVVQAAALDIATHGGIDNSAGTLRATSAAGAGLSASTDGVLDNAAGRIESAQNMHIAAGSLAGPDGHFLALGDLAVRTAHDASAVHGSWTAGGTLDANVGGTLDAGAATIDATGAMALAAHTLDNRQGRIVGGTRVAIATTADLRNDAGLVHAASGLDIRAGAALSNRAGTLEAAGADAGLSLHAASIESAGGRIVNAGTGATTVASDGALALDAPGTVLAGQGAVHVTAQSLSVGAGASLSSGGPLALDIAAAATNRGSIASQGDLAFVQPGATLDNRQGRLGAAGDMDLQLRELDNTGGAISADANLRLALRGDTTQSGLLHAGADLAVVTDGALANAGTIEAAGTLRTDSAALANRAGGKLQAGHVDLHAAGALDNAGEITGGLVDAHADRIANTGAITGGQVSLSARTIANTGDKALIGATRTVVLQAGQGVDNTDGATVYSAGDIAIDVKAGGLLNRAATIEAGRDIAIAADTVRNERPVLSAGQVQSLEETHTLTMPAWWHNSDGNTSNYADSTGSTNFSAYQLYYLDPADILENGSFVTPDGQVIGRAVVRTHADDTTYFSAHAGLGGAYGHRERASASDGTQVIYYQGRIDNAANPDQVAGADASAFWPGQDAVASWNGPVPSDSRYGHCASACVLLYAPWQYTDPTSTILRDSQRSLGPATALSELRRDLTTTATDDRMTLGAPARIAAGGNIRVGYGSSVTNSFGDVIAGGTLAIEAATPGTGSVTNQAATLYRRYHFEGTSTFANGSKLAWNQPDISQAIGSARGVLSGGQGVAISGQSVRNIDLAAGTAGNIVDTVQLTSGGQPRPAVEAAPGAAQSGFRTAPGALFSAHPQPGVPYLYESRPEFADQRQWLSSDYLLKALGIDPAATQKRLGDGFYEQRLVNEQIGQLTGRRRLAGYADDIAQYQALLEAGASYALQYGLTPGVSLSAEQMAQLTTDLVWLQNETVTLADGSRQQVLVPRVYLAHLGAGVLTAGGALITGDALRIDARTIVNRGGTLGGADTRSARLLASADVLNQGGTIAAGLLGIQAGGDIRNDSLAATQNWAGAGSVQSATSASNVARIEAGQTLLLDAGRDIAAQGGRIASGGNATLHAGRDIALDTIATGRVEQLGVGRLTNAQNSQQTHGTTVSAGASLSMQAGRDITLAATQVGAAQDAVLRAGRNIAIGAASDTTRSDKHSDTSAAPAFAQTRQSSTSHGSAIRTGGTLGLQAGTGELGDIAITGSTLDARGATALVASHDVSIVEAHGSASSHDENRSTHKGILSSTTSHTERDSASDTAVGSSVGGARVLIDAGHDATVRGSNVVSDQSTAILAGNDIAIVAAESSRSDHSLEEKSKSGLMGSGGIGFTVGSRAQTTERDSTSTSAVASTVGSIGGGVTLAAGNRYTQTGSNVVAPGGDIAIRAKDVRITEARDTSTDQASQSTRQSGVTLAVTSPVIAAAQTALATAKAVGNTGDARMKALGVASAAMSTGTALGGLQGTGADGGPAGGGVNIALSIGASSSRSATAAQSDTARGSQVQGRNVSIAATGAGQGSNVLVRGSDITASGAVDIAADNRIDILAAQSTSQQHSTSSSHSASIGVSFGTDGLLLNASASGARGRADGSDVTQSNSHVTGGQRVALHSGGDTTIAGGVVRAEQVMADIAGDLRVESLQDTATFDSRQQSLGGSVSVGAGKMGGSLSVSQSKTKADYASVTEQSGIQAGSGGFQVRVKGDTTLVGGAIASSQAAVDAGRNRFDTAGLSTSDIQNHEDYKASGFSLGGGYSSGGTGKPSDGSKAGAVPHVAGGINGAAAGIGSASGHSSGTTASGISGIAGNVGVRTGDASGGVARTFDADKVQKDIGAQVQITSTFGQQAAKAVGDYADTQRIAAIALRTQAAQESDLAKQADLLGQAQEIENNWGPNGSLRIAAQGAVAGLSGGLAGALGAVSGAVSATAIADALAAAHIEGPLASAITAATSATVGGLLGGAVGASASINEVVNNYLQHSTNWRSSQWGAFKEELARCQTTVGCNVDGIYQRWAVISNDQQRVAMASMDAMLSADPSAAAEAGKSFGAAAAAMAVNPADVCATGDTRCTGFVHLQSNQASTIFRAGLVVAYSSDLVESGSSDAGRPPRGIAAESAQEMTPPKQSTVIHAPTSSTDATSGLPSGFSNVEDFARFGVNVRSGLAAAGYADVEPVLQGSAVTGKSFSTGLPFDQGRISDFDIALASPSLFRLAQELGISMRSAGTRTGPLSARDLAALGLTKFSSQIGNQVGREVNFMIYEAPSIAIRRAPSISLPTKSR